MDEVGSVEDDDKILSSASYELHLHEEQLDYDEIDEEHVLGVSCNEPTTPALDEFEAELFHRQTPSPTLVPADSLLQKGRSAIDRAKARLASAGSAEVTRNPEVRLEIADSTTGEADKVDSTTEQFGQRLYEDDIQSPKFRSKFASENNAGPTASSARRLDDIPSDLKFVTVPSLEPKYPKLFTVNLTQMVAPFPTEAVFTPAPTKLVHVNPKFAGAANFAAYTRHDQSMHTLPSGHGRAGFGPDLFREHRDWQLQTDRFLRKLTTDSRAPPRHGPPPRHRRRVPGSRRSRSPRSRSPSAVLSREMAKSPPKHEVRVKGEKQPDAQSVALVGNDYLQQYKAMEEERRRQREELIAHRQKKRMAPIQQAVTASTTTQKTIAPLIRKSITAPDSGSAIKVNRSIALKSRKVVVKKEVEPQQSSTRTVLPPKRKPETSAPVIPLSGSSKSVTTSGERKYEQSARDDDSRDSKKMPVKRMRRNISGSPRERNSFSPRSRNRRRSYDSRDRSWSRDSSYSPPPTPPRIRPAAAPSFNEIMASINRIPVNVNAGNVAPIASNYTIPPPAIYTMPPPAVQTHSGGFMMRPPPPFAMPPPPMEHIIHRQPPPQLSVPPPVNAQQQIRPPPFTGSVGMPTMHVPPPSMQLISSSANSLVVTSSGPSISSVPTVVPPLPLVPIMPRIEMAGLTGPWKCVMRNISTDTSRVSLESLACNISSFKDVNTNIQGEATFIFDTYNDAKKFHDENNRKLLHLSVVDIGEPALV